MMHRKFECWILVCISILQPVLNKNVSVFYFLRCFCCCCCFFVIFYDVAVRTLKTDVWVRVSESRDLVRLKAISTLKSSVTETLYINVSVGPD